MFWERFISLCDEQKKKPNRVAAEIGISSASVTKWKKGTIPNPESLGKIAEFFCVSIDYLLGKSEQKLDDQTWDAYAKKFEDEVNAKYESDWKMLRQLFPAITDEDIYPLIHQVVPSIRMMNHEGIKELGKRADELYRLREYMNQETRDIVDEDNRLWEEEQRQKEKSAD